MDIVNVIVTCTKDKRFPVANDCELRALPKGTVAKRAKEWQKRLSHRWRDRVPVDQLYAGDHWATVRSFSSSYFKIDVWVCSAGFGLIRMDDTITPYAATFSSNHADSVSENVEGPLDKNVASVWWARMTKWKGHFKDRPRSLTELVANYPKRATLVVASNTYLKAVADDLSDAVDQLSDPNLLSIVSAGGQGISGLSEYLIPCDARLQNVVNGVRRSLNTRIAHKILREARVAPCRSTLIKRYRKLLEDQPPIKKYDRTPMTDDEVREFIRTQLKADETLRHTPLLRILRDNGQACEQKRFGRLYREVRDKLDGA